MTKQRKIVRGIAHELFTVLGKHPPKSTSLDICKDIASGAVSTTFFCIAEIVCIIKHFSSGRSNFDFTDVQFSLRHSGNKAALVATLDRIIAYIKTGKAGYGSRSASATATATATVTSTASAVYRRGPAADMLAEPEHDNDDDDYDNDDDDNDDGSGSGDRNNAHIQSHTQSISPIMALLIPYGPKGFQIFHELTISGFKHEQALEGIKKLAAQNPNYSFEDVMISLLSEADGSNFQPQINDLATFNEDIDRAIRESEGERENIQARKRRRVQSLENDCSCVLAEVINEDFPMSVLVASSQGLFRKCVDTIDSLSCGMAPADTSSSSSSSSSSSGCKCATPKLKELRKVLVSLLIEESKSYKWYKEFSVPFLQNMAKKIEASVCK